MKIKKTKIASSLVLATLIVGCGKAGKQVLPDRERMIEDTEAAAQRAAATGDNIQGRYVADFVTINPHVNGSIPGSAVILREENTLKMFVRFTLGSPSAAHFQNIHMGNRCPNMSDDTNGDGFIDIQEAMAVVGKIIVPLDSDISSQRSQNRFWPKAFENGSYTWQETTSFKHFWSDLKGKDWDEKDDIVKLAEDQGLAITGKVVMIQGFSKERAAELPATVASAKRYPSYVTLPVACGIYMPQNEIPGEEYVDQIPADMPVGGVEEGQDRPAPEGAGEIPGNGTTYEGPRNTETGDDNTDVGSGESTSGSTGGATGSTTGSSTGTPESTAGSTAGSTTGSTPGTTTGSSSGGSTIGGTSGGNTSGGSTGGRTTTGGSSGGSTGGSRDPKPEDEEEGGFRWPWEW
jgi:hypothetical protein